MDFGLKGKTALVMGGSDGLGFAVADALVGEGCSVLLASRSEAKGKTAVERLSGKAKGASVSFEAVDLLDGAALGAWAKRIFESHTVDILVNNAGGPAAGDPMEITLAQWDAGYQSLLRGVIQLSQGAVPPMAKRGWGRILNITSTSAREIIPRLPVSSTFRAGLSGFTKELAKSVGRSGILVNNLLPGPTRTARLAELEKKSPEFYRTMETRSALGRVGEPEEIGRVAAFLCSGANTFVTGTDVLVDGGFTSAL